MNPEKVVFGFFIVLALTLNFGFFVGEIENPDHHHVYELFAVVVVNLIATVLKFGDRSQMGALLLATSLVAILQLIKPTAGTVYFAGDDLTRLDAATLRRRRAELQVIFQDPMASLNPRMRVDAIVAEPAKHHGLLQGEALRARVGELLDRVGLAVTVPAAGDDVKTRCHWVTTRDGGMGAVRELCELILEAKGLKDQLLAKYTA